jgi:molecular chaperone GrpE
MAKKLKGFIKRLFGDFSHFDDLDAAAQTNQSTNKMEHNNNETIVEDDNLTPDAAEQTAVETVAETTDAANDSHDSDNKNAELEAQVKELQDKYLRLAAEFDNYKRRNAKERLELLDTAAKDTISALLPVLDDFDRAAKANESATEVATVIEGFKLIQNRFLEALKRRGLRQMESQHQPFDADFHEAITELPMGDEMKGKVFDTVEKGYFLNDKIIRFAKVVVGK